MIGRSMFLLLTVLSAGCMMARYEEISSRPEYVDLINTTYRSREELPVGTTIRVVRALACTNYIFGDGDELEVELPKLTKYASHRATIRFTFGGKDILLKERGKASLNSALFEKIQG